MNIWRVQDNRGRVSVLIKSGTNWTLVVAQAGDESYHSVDLDRKALKDLRETIDFELREEKWRA